jgi:hypothetical protein
LTAEERARRLVVVRAALRAVERTPDTNGFKSAHRSILAAAFARMGAFDEALVVARGLDQKTFGEFRHIDKVWALVRIGMEQADAGRLEEARATMREAGLVEALPGDGAKKSRELLARGLVAVREDERAMAVIDTLEPKVRADLLSMVAKRRQRDGDVKWARVVFRRALKDADEFLHSTPAQTATEPMPATVWAVRTGASWAALALEAKHRSTALGLVARIHARAGDWAEAEKTLAMIPTAAEGPLPPAFRIAALRAEAGDVAGALGWARSLATGSARAAALHGLAVGTFREEGVE